MKMQKEMIYLLLGVFGLLILASLISFTLQKTKGRNPVIDNLNARIKAWWMMCLIFVGAMYTGGIASVILFGITSFLALREFITLTPTKPQDHRTLFWTFFIFTPVQYYLVAIKWYGLFSILIPVYAFLFIPIRTVLNGECEDFLARAARIQWALMICVYCISHAPGLLMLDIPGYTGNMKLLFYLVLVTQISDVLQYVFGKLFGKRPIAPHVSPNKTWEGFIGGGFSASFIGALLYWVTPFTFCQSWLVSVIIVLCGFAGGLTMSAIKRDRGVKDFGGMIQGHGGMLDRMDSICFSAPIFFHILRYFFVP